MKFRAFQRRWRGRRSIARDQLNEWKKSAEPLRQAWADGVRKVGGNPDTIMIELTAALAPYKAAY